MPAGFFLPARDTSMIIKPLAGPDMFPGARLVHRPELDDKKILKAERKRIEAALRNQLTKVILAVLEELPEDVTTISSNKINPLVTAKTPFEFSKSTFTNSRRDTFSQLTTIGWEPTDRGFKRIEIDWSAAA